MRPTTLTTQVIKQHIVQSMMLLKTLQDEVRVELHLAGMEARDQWKKLEQRISGADALAREARLASKQAIDDTVEAIKTFRASLKTWGE